MNYVLKNELCAKLPSKHFLTTAKERSLSTKSFANFEPFEALGAETQDYNLMIYLQKKLKELISQKFPKNSGFLLPSP